MAEDDKHLEIKIRLRPRSVERFIFIVIILALLVLYFFFPFRGIDSGSSVSAPVKTAVAKEEPAATEEDTAETAEEGTIASEDTDANTTEEEPAADETAAPSLSGKIDITITEVLTTKSSPELEHDDKISRLKFKITNGKEDFKPKIRIYWFDDTDEITIKDLVRTEKSYTISSEAGKTFTDSITVFNMKFLSKTKLDEETFRLVLYDKDTDKELDRDTLDKTGL